MNYEQNHASQVNLSLFQNIPEHFNESREDLLSTKDDRMYYSNSHLSTIPNSSSNLAVSTNNMYIPSTESLHNPNHMESRTSLQTSSILDINPMGNAILGSSQWNPSGSNTSLVNRAQSSSCVDLTNSNANINMMMINNNNNHLSSAANKERFLPKYRPAPAYEVAIQQKYKGSQPDVSIPQHVMYENFHHHSQLLLHHPPPPPLPQHQQPKQQHFPDVLTQITRHTSNNMINPNYADASDYLSQPLKMFSLNPPPQYPANRLSSASTPDLALAHSHHQPYRGRGVSVNGGGVVGYKTSGSSPDLVSSRTLLQQHGYMPSHSVLYPYTSSIATNGAKQNQRLRHSHSFLPHATYENLNFIETTNPSFFPTKMPNNNMIYRTVSSAAAQKVVDDMEFFLHNKQQHRNHSLNALNLNLSNSHISEPIYENVPLPTTTNNSSTNVNTIVERKISFESRQRAIQQQQQTEASALANNNISISSVSANNMVNAFNNNNNGSNKNINDPLNGNESAKKQLQQQHHYIFANNNDNNGNKISGSASIHNISSPTERDVNLNHLPSSAAASSPFHIENLQMKQQRQQMTTSVSTLMNTSGTSSNYTMNTTTTADTTDSGISTEMGKKESKRNKIWNFLGKNKNSSSSSSKQKSATLGREKDKSKKDKNREMSKEAESNLKHRWSTGLPRLQPLPANISKEKLCQLLDAKLTDSQLFLEFERIPKRKENAQFTCALMEENRNKNIDPTCLPMDENRVKLIPNRENRLGYVNASHITVSKN